MLTTLTAVGASGAIEEIPEVEIFGGFSMMKMGAVNKDIWQFQKDIYSGGSGWMDEEESFFLNRGMAGSIAVNLSEYFSIVTDVKYNQGDLIEGFFEFQSSETQTLVQTPFVIGIKTVSALAGPRISFRREKGTVFVHALAGLDYWRLNGDYIIAGKEQNRNDDKFGPGIAIGGGIDINVHEKIAVRVIQADYYRTRQMERWMNNVNFSFGIVFRVGEIVLK